MFLIGIAIFLSGIFLSMFFKHVPLYVLVNPAAIAMQLFALAAVLTATQGFKVFYHGFKAAIFPKKPIVEEVRGRAATLFRMLSRTAILASLIGLIIGVISTLMKIDISDLEMLGHALSASLAAPLWGMIFAALFEAVVFVLKKRQETEKQKSKT